MSILGLMYSFQSEMNEIQRMNQKKVDECYDKYFVVAPTLPRKKKKAMRKKANRDYKFWKGIQEWHKETFTF